MIAAGRPAHHRDSSDVQFVGSTGATRPRICMFSPRNFAKKPFQCGLYEAQDVLCDTENVDVIVLEPGRGFRLRERWHRRLVFHDISGRFVFANPGLGKFRMAQTYDLFIAVCQNHWDLLYLNAIEGWRERCKTSICWIDEMWAATLPAYKHWLPALKQFDHLFAGYLGSVGRMSEAIGRTCTWLPGGADTLRFSPYPCPVPRVVDVYSIGRRSPEIHDVLLAAASRKEIFYVHDTCDITGSEVYDHRQHRDAIANMAKRSRYFLVAPGKVDDPSLTGGQVEVGYRYFEGAAAGAVLIGQAPKGTAFDQAFPWPDAVIPVKHDGSDIRDVLSGLNADAQRLSAISRRNSAQSLLRHDWVYRWEQMFDVVGIEPSPGMLRRKDHLRRVAALAETEAHE